MANLLELKDTLLQEGASYDSLSPYNKMIKKFEFLALLLERLRGIFRAQLLDCFVCKIQVLHHQKFKAETRLF